MRQALIRALVGIVILTGGIYIAYSRFNLPHTTSPSSTDYPQPTPISTTLPTPSTLSTFLVTRVIDGDTIEIEGGLRVRYIGIDTPETVDPKRPVQCFGKQASDKNKELVLDKRVKLEKDISDTDKYGRLLRYVWSDNTFVNDYLVHQGYAHASSYPPDVKYQEQFLQAEREARENSRGLWSPKACVSSDSSTSPSTPTSQTAPNSSCLIKGNINSKGDKIYHVPGQRYYEKTQIDDVRGERWFCSEDEAQNAGWRKSKV